MSTTTKAGASTILALIAADPNLSPAFARAIAMPNPRPWWDSDEPDYSDDEPIRDDRFADCAAADWWAGRRS